MTTPVVLRPQALDEIAEAAEWYDERGSTLGAEFLRAVDALVASIQRNPSLYPVVDRDMHRALLRRFPYSLIFRASPEEIVILACVYWRQHPRRWRSRR